MGRKFVVRLRKGAVVAQGLTAEEAARILVELSNCSGWDYVIEPQDQNQV